MNKRKIILNFYFCDELIFIMNKMNNLNAFLILIFCILMTGNSFSITPVHTNSRPFIVIIDPGHGGKDPGAMNKNIHEKDVVLAIGLKLGKLINENHPDVKVIYTRNTDVFIPLIDRSRIANKSKADLFISLHANICATPSIKGTETYFLGPSRSDDNLAVAKKENSVILLEKDYSTTYEGFDPNSPESNIMFEMFQSAYLTQSLSFAEDVQQQFKSRNESSNRGVKQAGFLVLRESSMPSVLVETGFLSNQAEANYLNSEEGQQQIAHSILEAFKKFKNKYSGSGNNKTPEVIARHQKLQDTTPKQEVIANHQKNQDTTPKQEVLTENIKVEENKLEAKVIPTTNVGKTEPPKVDIARSPKPVDNGKTNPADVVKAKTVDKEKAKPVDVVKTSADNYFSVQIGANTTPVEPTPANFKGFNNVRREKTDKYYRYYIGNESSIDKINMILKPIKLKFPQAFIVSFVEGKRIPLFVGSK